MLLEDPYRHLSVIDADAFDEVHRGIDWNSISLGCSYPKCNGRKNPELCERINVGAQLLFWKLLENMD